MAQDEALRAQFGGEEGAQARSSTRSMALGVYFSTLVEFWLRFCPAFRVDRFASGKPIVSASNQTVGQLKFLFRCFSGAEEEQMTDLHVESSVKFFLLHPLHERLAENAGGGDGEQLFYPLEQFVGPHLAENLAWRAQEVARKLDMCRGPSVRAWLHEHYSEDIASHIVLRGYLFYPLQHFRCTADVTRQHEWDYHRIPRRDPGDTSYSIPLSHPSIAHDHLCGWWTSNFEAELRTKVGANDPDRYGESLFVVLPKLHWLSPVIATEESASGRVFVESEPSLGAEEVEAMTLDALVVFVNSHFEALANSPPDIKSNGAMAMPLFVAEIIRCQPEDQEYCESDAKWKELSRGFVLDPRCWDPVPLCQEPVRFRRATRRKNGRGEGEVLEREYEGRTGWRRDGVIKEEEVASNNEDSEPLFSTPETVTPPDLASRIATGLEEAQKGTTHAVLKSAVLGVLASRSIGSDEAACEVGKFVYHTITFVVFELYSSSECNSKQVQRVGHLVLDALESSISNKAHTVREIFPNDKLGDWLTLLLQVAKDNTRWDFFSLILRALEIVCVGDELSQFGLDTDIELMIEDLAACELRRWNSTVVEAIRVLYSSPSSLAEVDAQTEDLFRRFVAQEDWTNAERLAAVTRNPGQLRALLDQFTHRNMTKALKRLRKICQANFFGDDNNVSAQVGSWIIGNPAGVRSRVIGPSVNHKRNREISHAGFELQGWEYVDTIEKLQDVVDLLEALEGHLQISFDDVKKSVGDTIVGLDCEWRPQFLQNEPSLTKESTKQTGTSSDYSGKSSIVAENSEDLGVSLYQIAVGGRVFVVDVQALEQTAALPLQAVWKQNSPFIVVGFCIAGDLKRLTWSFPDLAKTSSLADLNTDPVELKRLASYRQLPVDTWGLSRLYLECFGEEMSKDEQCSDWGRRPLTAQQLEYAAMDAHAVRITTLHLLADLVAPDGLISSTRDLSVLMRSFDVDRSVSVWHSERRLLGKADVHAALLEMGLERAVSFHTISKELWSEGPRHETGLVVKSIAVVAKRGQTTDYAVVVIQLDRTINMQALADCLGVASSNDITLAGQQVTSPCAHTCSRDGDVNETLLCIADAAPRVRLRSRVRRPHRSPRAVQDPRGRRPRPHTGVPSPLRGRRAR